MIKPVLPAAARSRAASLAGLPAGLLLLPLPGTALSLNNLALLHRAQTNARAAEPLLQRQSYAIAEGEQHLSLSLLRRLNPELSSWPSTEPLPAGEWITLPVRRAAPAAEGCVEALG